ncbi:MAG: NrpR regulatory domain-containing protein [Methanobacteriaceae archaeon]|uniref:NrpR regulatory domain-containing protein n=1 Tax=unclassified Methanobrevibacter TaxID=2638681 RepID=UPI003764A8F2|nr:NrpR regulatory domain-containing protein [Methanobacteriaceae archaeon]MDD4593979.1 NrpR regulatory domain-containing protein [Methanobacteriaceae archaeon]
MSESEHRMIEILRILSEQDKAIGSKVIANELKNKGYNLGERAVRYHMQILDEKGFSKRKGYSGRIITESGRKKLEKGLIYDQVDFIYSKFEEMMYKTNFDFEKKTGKIIVNKSNVLDESAFEVVKNVFDAGLAVSPLISVEKNKIGESLGYSIKTICSTTIDGILLSNGIASQPIYGGLVNVEDYTPTNFTELISYKKTSMSPLNAFIAKDMTSVREVVKNGNGIIPANFRVIPSAAREKTINILEKLNQIGINGILKIGENGETTLGVPVNEGLVGIALIGGVTPLCAAQELNYDVDIETIDEFEEYKNLKSISKPKNILKTSQKSNQNRIPFLLSKSWNLIQKVNFDLNSEKGKIISNISYIDKEDLDFALNIMKKTYKDSPDYINPYYKLINHPGNPNKIGIGTICSLTIDGILMNNGILSTPKYGGLIEIGSSPQFIEMISYNGSSLDPHKIFIFKNMTNITKKKIYPQNALASIKEVPYVAREKSKDILSKLIDMGLSIYKIGKPRELVYNAKVNNYNFGIVAGSGLNSIAAMKENNIDIEVKAAEKLIPFNELEKI